MRHHQIKPLAPEGSVLLEKINSRRILLQVGMGETIGGNESNRLLIDKMRPAVNRGVDPAVSSAVESTPTPFAFSKYSASVIIPPLILIDFEIN